MNSKKVHPISSNDKKSQQEGRRKADGHEIPLSSFIAQGHSIWMKLNNGKFIEGKVTSFDEVSITVLVFIQSIGEYDKYPTTYFKHAIQSFTRRQD